MGAGSARKGKATEQLLAAIIVLASGGEINALTAMVDDEGVDLSLKRRNGTTTLDLQVKSAFMDERKSLRERGSFIADVRLETFRDRDDLFMLYVVIDGSRAELLKAWLVPSTVLASEGFRVRTRGTECVRFQASAKEKSQDKWSGYRLDRDQLAPTLLALIRKMDGV
jgi:hypothetical protein